MDETDHPARAQNRHGAAAFVGRRRELETLASALEDAVAGRGRVVALSGAPGIGKTRTTREFTDMAEIRGAKVMWGWCYEHQGAPPYWPWLQLLRSYVDTADPGQLQQEMGPGAADISEILPELTTRLDGLVKPPALDPEEARFRLFLSSTNFLKKVSLSQPLVLVLDDLHWADESSLLLLEFLAREIAASSIVVVGGYRDLEIGRGDPLTKTLGMLDRESHFQRVQLEGLSRQEVGEFVEVRVGAAVAGTAVDTLYQRTEGNPLFVGEVVDSVSPEEMSQSQDWTAAIPEAVREAILQRVRRLSEPCNQMLRAASVVGRDFDLPLLRTLIPDVAEGEFLESLDEALGLRIVEPLPGGPGRYRFSHALIQQAVYEEITPMRQAQVHSVIGEALEQQHQGNLNEYAGELARHFAEAAALGGTEKMVRYSLIAGERALETFAYEQALIHFGRVLESKDGQAADAESAGAQFGLCRAQAATLPRHEMQEAQLNRTRAFDYYASVGDTVNIVTVAEFPFPVLSQLQVEGGRLVVRALDLIPEGSLEAARLHSYHGNIQGMVYGDYPSARESFDRALAIARRESDSALEMRTLNFASQVEMWHHRFEESLESSLLAIDLAVTASDPRGEVQGRYWASLSSRSLGRWQEIQRQASAILKPAEQLGDRHWLATAHHTVGWPLMLRGEWNEAREANQRSVELMPLDPRTLMQRIILESLCGNRSEAEFYLEHLESVVLGYEAGPTTASSCLAFTSPLVRTILGEVERPEAGEASISAVLSSPSATPLFSTWARVGASLLAVLNDDTDSAGELYAALKPLTGFAAILFNVDRTLGLLAGCLGDLDSAVAHFQNADDFYRRAGFRPELAWVCLNHSTVLMRRDAPGDRDAASSILDESLSIAVELGMTPLADKASQLQGQMASRPVGGPSYPDGLSAREVEVLKLVAAGKSNQEIADELVITLRTAGNHVGNILNKTGLANRTEAAAYAIHQDIV